MESQRPVLCGEASVLTHWAVLPSQSQFSRKSSLPSISPPFHPSNWCSRLFIIRSFGWKVGHRHDIRNFSLGFSSGWRKEVLWPLASQGKQLPWNLLCVCSEGAGPMSSGPIGTACHRGAGRPELGNEVPG